MNHAARQAPRHQSSWVAKKTSWRVVFHASWLASSSALSLICALSWPGAGCSRATPKPAAERAQTMFQERCAPCHGPQGRGDGPAATALVPHPRDFAEASWQRAKSDEQLRQAIVGGGAAVGASALMPANPDLTADPAVLDALVAMVRGFGRHPSP